MNTNTWEESNRHVRGNDYHGLHILA